MSHRKGSQWRSSKLDRLIEVQFNICTGCGKPMLRPGSSYRTHRDMPSLDHTIPLCLGGKNGLGNMTAMHILCNNMKGDDQPTGCELIWLEAVNARMGIRK